jgi:hypothetical protein
VRFLAVTIAIAALSCAAGSNENSAGTRPKPPPRPGSSITHTQMCSCTACPVARCCENETDEPEGKTCTDSYDFSGGCGMAVQSCTGRCYQKVWRARLDQACDEKRPDECCAGR